MNYKKRGQIWIETVLYTLIGLVLIGMVLSVAIPFVEKQKDKKIVEDSLVSLNVLDNNIEEIRKLGPGNQRQLDFLIAEGSLIINPNEENSFNFSIEESTYAPSEVGRGTAENQGAMLDVPGTNLKILTQPSGKEEYNIFISREFDFNSIDLKFENLDFKKEFNKAPTPYRLIIENLGRDATSDKLVINIYEAS